MGESYHIEIETERTLAQCQEILLKDIEHEILDNKPLEMTIRTPYFILWFRKLVDDDYAYSSVIGLKPTVQIVIYRFFRKATDSIPMLHRLFMKWVHAVNDTAILLYEGEKVLLLSKEGEFMRNRDATGSAIDEVIDKEYILKEFPIL